MCTRVCTDCQHGCVDPHMPSRPPCRYHGTRTAHCGIACHDTIRRMRFTTQWRAAFRVKSFKAAVIIACHRSTLAFQAGRLSYFAVLQTIQDLFLPLSVCLAVWFVWFVGWLVIVFLPVCLADKLLCGWLLFIFLSVCLSACLPVCLSVCLSLSLSLSLSLPPSPTPRPLSLSLHYTSLTHYHPCEAHLMTYIHVRGDTERTWFSLNRGP